VESQFQVERVEEVAQFGCGEPVEVDRVLRELVEDVPVERLVGVDVFGSLTDLFGGGALLGDDRREPFLDLGPEGGIDVVVACAGESVRVR